MAFSIAVPKSLREMICPRPSRESVWVCYGSLDSYQVYQIFVIAFAVIFGAFAMGDVQKTKLMQLITTIIRHTSFGLMIVLAIIGIIQHQGRSLKQVLAYEDPTEISTFLGVCIYSFMCHHRFICSKIHPSKYDLTIFVAYPVLWLQLPIKRKFEKFFLAHFWS